MQAIEIIQKKRDNKPLLKEEINFIIKNFQNNNIPNYQMSAFLMAICINGMSEEETSWLTDSMLYSGEVVIHKNASGPLIDKHSTGGVGDKISIPLAPTLAACGLFVPMIAGRGLGHTGGTLDKLEAIPGFRTDLSLEEYKNQVAKIGCVIMGQTKDIAPADKVIYALRDVSGTVESIPLISSSIMSKKLAEGIDGLVLDVKFGSGAFMKELEKARMLASTMVKIGAHMGKKITACLTSMDQPLGTMIGNSLEIIESIDILRGDGPSDSVELTLILGAEMLVLAHKVGSFEEGKALVKEKLHNGQAFERFVHMVEAQGGDISYILEPSRFRVASQRIVIEALEDTHIAHIDCRTLGHVVSLLGGGRMKLTDTINPSVGLELHAKIGDFISKGQALCTIHSDNENEELLEKVKNAFSYASHAVPKPVLYQQRISTN
jgi:pyrimidine-nucleoside phosphorylase